MKYMLLLISFMIVFPIQAHQKEQPSLPQSVKCFLTMVKGGCWKAYDLVVDLSDADSGKLKKTILVPADQFWTRQEFDCKPGDTLALVAKFSPAFWQGDEEKEFKGQRYWKLPNQIEADETGWNVTVCYPEQFADVPRPPDANTDCTCDLTKIPKIEPQKRS